MHFHVGICRGLTVGTVTPWSCSIHWWIQFYLLKESNIYGYDYQIMVGISIFQDMGHFWVRLNFLWYFLLNTSMFWKVKRFLHVGFDYIRVHNLFFFLASGAVFMKGHRLIFVYTKKSWTANLFMISLENVCNSWFLLMTWLKCKIFLDFT